MKDTDSTAGATATGQMPPLRLGTGPEGARHIRSLGRWRPLLGAMQSRPSILATALGLRLLAPVSRSLDRLLAPAPQRAPDELAALAGRSVFVVCPPRSGGTLFYQALVQSLPSVYLTNLHAFLPRLAGCRKAARSASLASFYGYASGLSGVYEGNEFWGWLHRAPEGDKTQDRAWLRTQFLALLALLRPQPGQCAIFKNARSYAQVGRLHLAVPEMVFVRVRRNPQQVVESVVKAARQIGSFHPVPPQLQHRSTDDLVEFAVAMVQQIDADLNRQFAAMDPARRLEIDYEAFCTAPHQVIGRLAADYLGLADHELRLCQALSDLRPSQRKKVSQLDAARIKRLLVDYAGLGHG